MSEKTDKFSLRISDDKSCELSIGSEVVIIEVDISIGADSQKRIIDRYFEERTRRMRSLEGIIPKPLSLTFVSSETEGSSHRVLNGILEGTMSTCYMEPKTSREVSKYYLEKSIQFQQSIKKD